MDSKSTVFMAKNGKDTKHTRHIAIKVHFVRNGEICKINKIDWCEGVTQLAVIVTKNVGENDLNTKIKYTMVMIDDWERTIAQEGKYDTGQSTGQQFCMTILYWFEDFPQPVWNFCIKFDKWKNIENCIFYKKKMVS